MRPCRVTQHTVVAVILSGAVVEDALGPKLTEEVSGSDSGHDLRSQNFRVPNQPSAHSAWRRRERASDAHIMRMMIGRVQCVPEMDLRAPERCRSRPVRIDLTGISERGASRFASAVADTGAQKHIRIVQKLDTSCK